MLQWISIACTDCMNICEIVHWRSTESSVEHTEQLNKSFGCSVSVLLFTKLVSPEGDCEDSLVNMMCFNLDNDLQIIAYAKCRPRTDEKYKWSAG